MNFPLVLVLSEGKVSPEAIISKLKGTALANDVQVLLDTKEEKIIGYPYGISTKYYNTEIILVPYNKYFLQLPKEILENIEAALIYFDSENKNFSGCIPKYAEFLKGNKIDLGILLCDKLYENSKDGITYSEAKQKSKYLDVIELGRTREENEEENFFDPIGYAELTEALQSFLWSNMAVNKKNYKLGEKFIKQNGYETSTVEKLQSEPQDIESELQDFEKLLTEVLTFQNDLSSLSRNERLDYVKNIADKFEELIGDDTSNHSE